MTVAQDYCIKDVCEVVDCPRSSVYYRAVSPDDQVLRDAIEELAAQYVTYGYRRITQMLQRQGWSVNHKRVYRLMGEMKLLQKKRSMIPRTTDSNHDYGRYPNWVQSLEITFPDQVWVADITYVHLGKGYVYLAVIMDVFTRAIRGWQLSRHLDASSLTVKALERALQHHCPQIHHSDQGKQYACHDYVALLRQHGVKISMAAVGEPRENGYAERLIRTLKEEAIHASEFEDFTDAYQRIGHFIEHVYMTKRIHSSLNYLTPHEFEMIHLQQQLAIH